MIFRFHPAARIEFREAVAFYEERSKGLGGEFASELLYSVESGHILILALMHCSRMPGYWRNRMPD